MYVKEFTVSVMIFIVLFLCAWFLHEQTKRQYIDVKDDQAENRFKIQSNDSNYYFPSFMSREYIRIEYESEKTIP